MHWNFFFTLALMPVLGAVVWPLRCRGLSWTLIGALITICEFQQIYYFEMQGRN